MAEQETIRKPSWSLDVKIISHTSDMMDTAGDLALKLEMGDGNALFELQANLQEVYLRLGGDVEETEGDMLDPKAKADLKLYFEQLNKWETENLKESMEKQKIEPQEFLRLRQILRMIRSLLYSEVNRLFVKFITIYSDQEKMDRLLAGRMGT
jgi:hypothetical protein